MSLVYRVFTHRPTGRHLPVLMEWDGHDGTPSVAYIPALARQFRLPAEEIEASDSDAPPDFTRTPPVEPPPPPETFTDPWGQARYWLGLAKIDPTVPENLIGAVDALLDVLDPTHRPSPGNVPNPVPTTVVLVHEPWGEPPPPPPGAPA